MSRPPSLSTEGGRWRGGVLCPSKSVRTCTIGVGVNDPWHCGLISFRNVTSGCLSLARAKSCARPLLPWLAADMGEGGKSSASGGSCTLGPKAKLSELTSSVELGGLIYFFEQNTRSLHGLKRGDQVSRTWVPILTSWVRVNKPLPPG